MKTKGFTLLEVLLVMTLIGILLGIVLTNLNLNERFARARNDIRRNDIQTLESVITQYRLQEGSYPPGITQNYQEICDPDASSCTGYVDLSALIPTYIQEIPQDPNDEDIIEGSGYSIAVDTTSNTIRISAILAEGGERGRTE